MGNDSSAGEAFAQDRSCDDDLADKSMMGMRLKAVNDWLPCALVRFYRNGRSSF